MTVVVLKRARSVVPEVGYIECPRCSSEIKAERSDVVALFAQGSPYIHDGERTVIPIGSGVVCPVCGDALHASAFVWHRFDTQLERLAKAAYDEAALAKAQGLPPPLWDELSDIDRDRWRSYVLRKKLGARKPT